MTAEVTRNDCGAAAELLRSCCGAAAELLRSCCGAASKLLRNCCGNSCGCKLRNGSPPPSAVRFQPAHLHRASNIVGPCTPRSAHFLYSTV